MAATQGASEVWQARIDGELAVALRQDASLLGLHTRTEIVRAALGLLRLRAAQERMAREVDAFYAGELPPRPIGVRVRRTRRAAS